MAVLPQFERVALVVAVVPDNLDPGVVTPPPPPRRIPLPLFNYAVRAPIPSH
jgi:hypothetical protein